MADTKLSDLVHVVEGLRRDLADVKESTDRLERQLEQSADRLDSRMSHERKSRRFNMVLMWGVLFAVAIAVYAVAEQVRSDRAATQRQQEQDRITERVRFEDDCRASNDFRTGLYIGVDAYVQALVGDEQVPEEVERQIAEAREALREAVPLREECQ